MANLSEIILFKIYHCIFSIAYKNHASTAPPGENIVKKYLLAIELDTDKRGQLKTARFRLAAIRRGCITDHTFKKVGLTID